MKTSGFTLVELMIVVAIVGVLAAIALPVYDTYIARSQVSEAIAMAGAVRISLSDYYASFASFPPAGQYSSDVGRYTLPVTHGASGVISMTMLNDAPVNNRVRAFEMTMTPECRASDGVIANWRCDAVDPVMLRYLPSGCQFSPVNVSAGDCGTP